MRRGDSQRSRSRADVPADDPPNGFHQAIEGGRRSAWSPVDQAGRLYASKAEWWLDRFEQDRNEDPSALPLAGFFDHPVRRDGMTRPGDDDALGVDKSFTDMAVPRLARRHLAVPEYRKSMLFKGSGQLANAGLILTRITQKNVGPWLGLAQWLIPQSLSRL
jgi:hypothetical protein